MPEANRVCLGRKSLAGLRQKVIRIRAVDAGFIKTPIAWRDEVKQRGVIRIPKGRSKTYPCHVIYYPCLPTSSSSSSSFLSLPLFDDPILRLSDQFKNRYPAVDNGRHIILLHRFSISYRIGRFLPLKILEISPISIYTSDEMVIRNFLSLPFLKLF